MPGVILLILWIWNVLNERIDFSRDGLWPRRLPAALGLLAICAGGGFFLQRQLTPPHALEFQANARKVNEIADHFYKTSRAAGLTRPRYGTDVLTDFSTAAH